MFELPVVQGLCPLTFSTSVRLDRTSEIRYNILKRMRGQPVLVIAIHDLPTERGTAYPQSLREALQSTREDSGVRLRNFRYGGHHLSKRKKPVNNTDIPQHQIEAVARCILPDILAFYESIEGQREFEEWKKQRQAEQKE